MVSSQETWCSGIRNASITSIIINSESAFVFCYLMTALHLISMAGDASTTSYCSDRLIFHCCEIHFKYLCTDYELHLRPLFSLP
jgi:hypothetical protein